MTYYIEILFNFLSKYLLVFLDRQFCYHFYSLHSFLIFFFPSLITSFILCYPPYHNFFHPRTHSPLIILVYIYMFPAIFLSQSLTYIRFTPLFLFYLQIQFFYTLLPARQATQTGGIDSLKSIPGLLNLLQIRKIRAQNLQH